MPEILKLEQFQLTELTIKWHEDGDEGREERLIADGQCGLSYDVFRQKDDPLLFAVKMRFQFTPKEGQPKVGYEIDTTIDGFFSFPKTMPEEEMQKLVRLNGLTILYGILRGELASVTGMFPPGRFILPAVYMPEIIATIEAQRAAPPKKRSGRQAKESPDKKK